MNILAFTFISCTLCSTIFHATAEPTSSSLAANFIAIGYDILKGNPEGDFSRGGLDPGLLLTRRVLKMTYDNRQCSCYVDQGLSVPDQVVLQPVNSCSSVKRAYAYSGTSSYQKKLDASIRGSVSGILNPFRFSLSAGFSEVRDRTDIQKRVTLDKEVICTGSAARYRLQTALNNNYSISEDFYYAVKNLPVTYNETKYIDFIKKWGTHFVVEANLGGRLVERSSQTFNYLYNSARREASSSISSGGAFLGYRASFTVDVNTFNKEITESTTFGDFEYRVTSGSTIEQDNLGNYHIRAKDDNAPIPVQITLEPITTVLQPQLWIQLPETDETFESLQIASKRSNTMRAIEKYPEHANSHTGDDPTIQFPNAWPDGTYSLPKAASGCPASGVNHFIWAEGSRYQDNEDSSNANRHSASFHLSGDFGRNIRTRYCTKTVTSKDFGIKWPRGSYCIANKGNCPEGFDLGSIKWDDEDSNNKNSRDGVLPDGDYDRNTRIYYCCRHDAHPHNTIILPTDRPFYLMRQHSDGCQRVTGMQVTDEYIHFDDEDHDNSNSRSGSHPYDSGSSRNHELHYCYYH